MTETRQTGSAESENKGAEKRKMRLYISKSIELDAWIKERHYLHTLPPAARIRMEFTDDEGKRIGAMLWGVPTSPKLDHRHLLELTRMFFVEEAGKNTESRALSMARKHIRKHYPEITGLIAYSSTAEKHKGTVYLADGWFKISETRSPSASWANRPNRKDTDLSVKIKFGRTP